MFEYLCVYMELNSLTSKVVSFNISVPVLCTQINIYWKLGKFTSLCISCKLPVSEPF